MDACFCVLIAQLAEQETVNLWVFRSSRNRYAKDHAAIPYTFYIKVAVQESGVCGIMAEFGLLRMA